MTTVVVQVLKDQVKAMPVVLQMQSQAQEEKLLSNLKLNDLKLDRLAYENRMDPVAIADWQVKMNTVMSGVHEGALEMWMKVAAQAHEAYINYTTCPDEAVLPTIRPKHPPLSRFQGRIHDKMVSYLLSSTTPSRLLASGSAGSPLTKTATPASPPACVLLMPGIGARSRSSRSRELRAWRWWTSSRPLGRTLRSRTSSPSSRGSTRPSRGCCSRT